MKVWRTSRYFDPRSICGEKWEWIPEHENLYSASSMGRVYSHITGRILKPRFYSKYGHQNIVLYPGGLRLLHRVILETFTGPCPPGLEACHSNGRPWDNRLDNLRWDTRSNNRKDAINHGTIVNSRHGKAKLSENDVRIIRKSNGSPTALAKIYGVTKSHICGIQKGRYRKYVL